MGTSLSKYKVLKIFKSELVDSIHLICVVATPDQYVVRVLGEADIHFPSELEALDYAETKANEF